tara:strand:- start:3915 stop:4400 length:486 start_codon:yes stop_codon:yes gene_type:complete
MGRLFSNSGAIFSDCRKYRYALWRIWEGKKSNAMIIGLNPSAADEEANDRTIRRCISFASSWGYGGVYVTNLFGFIATSPNELLAYQDPVGKENDLWVNEMAKKVAIKVAAWGNHGKFLNRSEKFLSSLDQLHCIQINKSGEPAHPLYLKAELKPFPLITY